MTSIQPEWRESTQNVLTPFSRSLHVALLCGAMLVLGAFRCDAAPPQAKKAPLASIKCWINRDGVRECGDAVPPEYSQQGYERKDSSGATVGTQGRAKSADELQQERERAQRQQDEQRLLEQQQTRDRILLQTYASADDLELARDGQLQNIDAQIRVAENHMAKLQANLATMIEAAANQERRGDKPKPETIANIESIRAQITGDESTIATRLKEKEVLTARYAAELVRYRELKDLPQAQSSLEPAGATVPPNTSSASP